MQINVISIFPEMFTALQSGVTGKALQRGLWQLQIWNPRDYATDKFRHIDDRPYGGGPGMLMKLQPLYNTIRAIRKSATHGTHVIYLSPQGKILQQSMLTLLLQHSNLTLLSGRYEGIDERLIAQEVDEEYSIGDYVLSGGELPAMVMIDSLVRLLPGSLGNKNSAKQDSFAQGLLDHPHYTRPEMMYGVKVPSVLLSGDHEKIRRWRMKQALGRTWLRRPELLNTFELTVEQQALLQEFIDEHQVLE